MPTNREAQGEVEPPFLREAYMQAQAKERARHDELMAALDMLRWARAALDSGYRSTRHKQEIAKIDAFFAALKARAQTQEPDHG